MNIRYTHSPKDIEHYSTKQLRDEFLVESIFVAGQATLTYTHNDRMIFGGVVPTDNSIEIVLNKELGVEYFLERRELGVINIGGPGAVIVDKKEYNLVKQDGLYIGKETKEVIFKSDDINNPAKFYIASTPAHHKYPTHYIKIDEITPLEMGNDIEMNKRKIYQYIHPNITDSCQLQMGYTILDEGNSWNTMPVHTHERRMEVYLYFDMEAKTKVFHLMGKPDETKHLVIGNEQAAISPSWSIHSGVGTKNYSFIWSMCGENITYTDMDHIDMDDLK